MCVNIERGKYDRNLEFGPNHDLGVIDVEEEKIKNSARRNMTNENMLGT